jgi:hypothetical protein
VTPQPDDAAGSSSDPLLETDLDDLASRSIEEIRALRTACVEVETGLSYLRRMVQGPLDIARREQQHRSSGDPADLAGLVAELPEVLGEGPRAGGLGRLSSTLEPTRVDPVLEAELASIVGSGQVADITTVDDDQLATLIAELGKFERKVSDRRRQLHHRIDALQAEVARRYQSGEASVESLLD